MTTYNRGYEASLAKYNARKRELQASMLEYSEHMRNIHAKRDLSPRKASPESSLGSLEVRAEGNYFTRHSDRAFLTKRLRHERRARMRPSSLDEKELQLNASIRETPKRDTKSERPPITIPTALPPLIDPPNSPDFSKRGNVRVSFVSASDLYDLVDFGDSPKSSRKESTKIANVRDGIKLIEDIDLQNRRERHIAWEKQTGKENSPTRVDDSDFLTGRRINPLSASSSNSKDSSNSNALPKSKVNPDSKENGQFVVRSSNPDEILPLNMFLEQAVVSHTRGRSKVRTRPKRAKRMQLHKSNLVVIPEDGGTFVSPDKEQSSSIQESKQKSKIKDNSAKSTSSTTPSPTLKDSHMTESLNENIVISPIPRSRSESPAKHNDHSPKIQQRHSSLSISDERSRKPILKKPGQGPHKVIDKERQQLANLIVSKGVYPLEKDLDEKQRVKHVTFDTNLSKIRARRKLKRLVFLQDQPEQNYRNEI